MPRVSEEHGAWVCQSPLYAHEIAHRGKGLGGNGIEFSVSSPSREKRQAQGVQVTCLKWSAGCVNRTYGSSPTSYVGIYMYVKKEPGKKTEIGGSPPVG